MIGRDFTKFMMKRVGIPVEWQAFVKYGFSGSVLDGEVDVIYKIPVLDSETRIDELKQAVAQFALDREWEPFHSLKNLSMSIAIEASELMERFQWLEGAESNKGIENPEERTAIEEEFADVFIYLLQFANRADIDLATAARRKLELNAEKYPVEKSRGRSNKYDAL